MKGPIVIKWSVYKIREVDIIEAEMLLTGDAKERHGARHLWGRNGLPVLHRNDIYIVVAERVAL